MANEDFSSNFDDNVKFKYNGIFEEINDLVEKLEVGICGNKNKRR
jgi:hypothetical protein